MHSAWATRGAAAWRAHYAAIPADAIVTAELRWNNDTWITAFVEHPSDEFGSLRVVAKRPLTLHENAACLRWLRAEGFADLTICRAGERTRS